ncbi:MAG: GNAT family N-acetyltransferase [Clostridia bacterium]|jgi:GNAT superfamily N-acetyltransferase|nr:GNAT family N-acetyltransferase [Clostridia bacterium]
MQIRKATQQDFEAFMKISEDTCYSTEVKGSPKQNCIPSNCLTSFLSREDVERVFIEFVKEDKVLLVENEERIIAFAVIRWQGRVCVICDFVVTRKNQLQGIGTYFTNAIIKKARKLRMKKIFLLCEFEGAMEFWKKMGFKEKAKGNFEKIL